MKFAIVIPDGAADDPQPELGDRTPLEAARMPHADRAVAIGQIALMNNVPPSLTPASDVATLSLFGYDPLECYTGRAPLEAAALGVTLGPNDWAIRCNLVHIPDGKMVDFTAGTSRGKKADRSSRHCNPTSVHRNSNSFPASAIETCSSTAPSMGRPIRGRNQDPATARYPRQAHRAILTVRPRQRSFARSHGALQARSSRSPSQPCADIRREAASQSDLVVGPGTGRN